jgi:hypothetical protein
MATYHIEVTDTYGGEANYCWKRDFIVEASSSLGAITKLAKSEGSGWRKNWDSGDTVRYNLQGACICAFVSYLDESAASSFNGAKRI